MLDGLRGAIDDHEARRVALGERMLRDELARQLEIVVCGSLADRHDAP
jgi:hypothetical protein